MGKMLDECFRSRMDVLRERFPLREFRREFVEQFARKGLVYIQGATLEVDVMASDVERGIIFSSQRNIDKALRLVRRWGFEVMERKPQGYTLCYQVMLPRTICADKRAETTPDSGAPPCARCATLTVWTARRKRNTEKHW